MADIIDVELWVQHYKNAHGREFEKLIAQGLEPGEANVLADQKAHTIVGDWFDLDANRRRVLYNDMEANSLDAEEDRENESLGGQQVRR